MAASATAGTRWPNSGGRGHGIPGGLPAQRGSRAIRACSANRFNRSAKTLLPSSMDINEVGLTRSDDKPRDGGQTVRRGVFMTRLALRVVRIVHVDAN